MDSRFDKSLDSLLNSANFIELDQSVLQDAVDSTSKSGLKMDVDFDAFSFQVFARGKRTEQRNYPRNIFKLKFYERTEVVTIYRRLIVKFKILKQDRFEDRIDPKLLYLKVFKDFPIDDIDMLLPGAKHVFSWKDWAVIVGPLMVAIISLIISLTTEAFNFQDLTTAMPFFTILVAFLGKAYKSAQTYLNLHKTYRARMTSTLYYKQLGANKAVLTQLHEEAERQIMREAILAYAFLWKENKGKDTGKPGKFVPRTSPVPSKEQLDKEIESWLRSVLNYDVNFEIGDALQMCADQGAFERVSEGLKARSIDGTINYMRGKWDSYF